MNLTDRLCRITNAQTNAQTLAERSWVIDAVSPDKQYLHLDLSTFSGSTFIHLIDHFYTFICLKMVDIQGGLKAKVNYHSRNSYRSH